MQARRNDERRERLADMGAAACADASSGVREPTMVPNAELYESPHEIFRLFRPVTPLMGREDGGYIVLRARDVEQLISDPRTRQSEVELPVSRGVTDGPFFDFFRNSMLFTNGLDHRRKRAPLARAFGVKVIEDLRPRIRSVADGLLDQLAARGTMNLLTDYAAQIPAHIIAAMLGIPEDDIPFFTGVVYRLARSITPALAREDIPEAVEAARQLAEYSGDLLARRRVEPRGDFLTAYLQATDAAGNLSKAES